MEILLKSTEVRQNAKNNAVYLNRPNLYIGFHGCDKSVGEKLLFSPNKIQISQNNYEWLGHGFYVWENNSERALDWAEHHPKIKNPFVIGVVYTLGSCLDLTDKHYIDLLANAYEGAKICAKTHIQVCLRNMDCVKGFFLPRQPMR